MATLQLKNGNVSVNDYGIVSGNIMDTVENFFVLPQSFYSDHSEIVLSICGEHGGDPEAISFIRKHGFTYVSCSPFRVPVARLAAAQCAISDRLSGQI